MRFAYQDLGHQPEGATVTVRLTGSSANVILVDPKNFQQYRAGLPFRYTGGLNMRSPVTLEVPEDGQWFVVVDLGGHRGTVRGRVTVTPPDAPSVEHALVED